MIEYVISLELAAIALILTICMMKLFKVGRPSLNYIESNLPMYSKPNYGEKKPYVKGSSNKRSPKAHDDQAAWAKENNQV